jgi:hypothetical protein
MIEENSFGKGMDLGALAWFFPWGEKALCTHSHVKYLADV